MKTQVKAIVASVVVIALCLAAVGGVTYSWFSDSADTTIDVTTGIVNVDMEVVDNSFQVYSWGLMDDNTKGYVLQQNGQFVNGGTATWSTEPNTLYLTLNNMAPGDKVTFQVNNTTTSSIDTKYRYYISSESDTGLINGLKMTASFQDQNLGQTVEFLGPGSTEWIDLDGADDERTLSSGSVTVELPTNTGNEYQGKRLVLKITIEAYQANALLDQDLFINTVQDLLDFAQRVNNGETFSGKTVALMGDLDMSGIEWTPIGLTGDNPGFQGTFEGNGYTISNLNVDLASEPKYQSAGLFGCLRGTLQDLILTDANINNLTTDGSSGTSCGTAVAVGSMDGGTVKNVTVKDSTISANRYAAGIVGYSNGTVTECNVENLIIVATPDNLNGSYDNGDKAGGIIGLINSSGTVTYNTVKNVSVTGYRDIGLVIGAGYVAGVENNTVSGDNTLNLDTTITTPDESKNAGPIIGRIISGSTEISESNTISGTVSINSSSALVNVIATEQSGPVTIELSASGNAYITNTAIAGDKNITIDGKNGATLSGQIFIKGSSALLIKSLNYNVNDEITDLTGISQTGSSALALWNSSSVTCTDVTFNQTKTDSTVISSWWSTGNGTTITVQDCTFNCNGQRPIRSDAFVTAEGCEFNDPYRYAIQMTSMAGTITGVDVAVVNFNNNAIKNGENGKPYVYGVQLEGTDYGCSNLIINGTGNTIDAGIWDSENKSTMYYCECGLIHCDLGTASIVWNTNDGEPTHEHGDILIQDVKGLRELAECVNGGNALTGKKIILTENIDLKNEEWTPIGTGSSPFKGTFDGNGKTISNLKVSGTQENSTDNNYHGLFGEIMSPAVLKGITIQNADVSGSLYVSALCGYGYTGTIDNCKVTGNVTITAWWYAGAINGDGYAQISNCNVYVSDSSSITATGSYVGGIVGYHGEGSITITNCYSNIDVTGFSYVGGITGIAHFGNTISDCTAECSVTTTVDATSEDNSDKLGIGGIAGITVDYNSPITIENCTFTGTITNGSGEELANGGVVGCNRSGSTDQTNLTITSCTINGTVVNTTTEGTD